MNWSLSTPPILVDASVLVKFLIDSIEGHQILKANSMVCLGVEGEAWQQDNAKLHKAYTPTVVSPDGWMTFVPKPEAVREYVQVVGESDKKFAIRAQWGEEKCDENGQYFIQYGEAGDCIFRDADPDHGVDAKGQEDVWIVKKRIYVATYATLTEENPVNLDD